MPLPIRECVKCGRKFELKPDKPGFANQCPTCSEPEDDEDEQPKHLTAEEWRAEREANAARRAAIKKMLYSGE